MQTNRKGLGRKKLRWHLFGATEENAEKTPDRIAAVQAKIRIKFFSNTNLERYCCTNPAKEHSV
jgi:hypothetical protein